MKKNIKVIGYMLWVMVALLVSAPTMAQAEAQQPNDNQFRSTSTMVGSGSNYSATPTINAGGTANAPTFGGGGPRYAPKPINDDDDWKYRQEHDGIGGGISTPVGDAVLPLLLMSLAFAGVIYMRRRKARAEQ